MIVVVGIAGYSGRMGQAIAETILSHPTACLAGGVTRSEITPMAQKLDEERPHIITDDPEKLFPQCDVVIDFSHASATADFARCAMKHGKPFLSGTTGLTDETTAVLREASAKIPVLHATNTSLSLVVVRHMIKLAARLLKDEYYDVSILDKHHRWKKDAPSGTALTLGQAILDGNEGSHLPAYASLRAGSIVGEHDILFAGAGETINVQHHVTDRRVFARGAVQAALWLAQQKPGLYTIDDVIKV